MPLLTTQLEGLKLPPAPPLTLKLAVLPLAVLLAVTVTGAVEPCGTETGERVTFGKFPVKVSTAEAMGLPAPESMAIAFTVVVIPNAKGPA